MSSNAKFKSQRERRAVWLPPNMIASLEVVATNHKMGFTYPRSVIELLIKNDKQLQQVRNVIDSQLDTDDCLQQIVDIVR